MHSLILLQAANYRAPFHPEWLVKFWLTTPIVQDIEPHFFSALVAAAIAIVVFIKRRKNKSQLIDSSEDEFQQLRRKKEIIEEQIEQLKERLADESISEPEYTSQIKEYEKLLEETNEEIKTFI